MLIRLPGLRICSHEEHWWNVFAIYSGGMRLLFLIKQSTCLHHRLHTESSGLISHKATCQPLAIP